ncbi:MAG: hypothetical protein ACE5FP_00515 [Gemmatimonadota bacterium]
MSPRRAATMVALTCAIGGSATCAGPRSDPGPSDRSPNPETNAVSDTLSIEAAQQELTERLLPLPGVEGTGIGECDGSPCILIFLAERSDELLEQIPSTHRGYRVEMRVTGEFRPRED